VHVDPPLTALFSALASEAAPEPPAALQARRDQANATMLLLAKPELGVVSTDHGVPVDGGEIRVRVLRPEGDEVLPAVYFVHGGGWFQGNLDTAAVESGPMASSVGCVVVSVEYRLAPEHPFPVPLEDVVAGWNWLHANAEVLSVDASRIAVAGTSAGGNLAAALCLAARDRGLPMPLVQLLDVPALDLTGGAPSLEEFAQGAGLTGAQVKQFAADYCGDVDPAQPLLSPLLAADLSGLPPAVVIVAEVDPVRDDGERWVRALQAAGVPAAGVRVLTQVHGSWIIPITVTAGLVQDLRGNVLRRAFDGKLVP
jgi:acetyl esterase